MIRVASPSKNRLNYTIDKVFDDYPIDIFVEPQDEKAYKERIRPIDTLIVIPENDKGFGYVCDYIAKYYKRIGIRHYLFADDDVFGIRSRKGAKIDIRKMLSEAEREMLRGGYAQMMISFGGHNWYVKEKFKENVGCWCMIFIDSNKIERSGGYDTHLKIFNDWDMSARLLTSGFKTACWYEYKFLHKMKSNMGGAMAYYTDDNFMKTQCGYLLKRYGENIRVIFHQTHNLYEVRFKWKKLMGK